jgi:hypothetical protein
MPPPLVLSTRRESVFDRTNKWCAGTWFGKGSRKKSPIRRNQIQTNK